jgi:hypothetical protein
MMLGNLCVLGAVYAMKDKRRRANLLQQQHQPYILSVFNEHVHEVVVLANDRQGKHKKRKRAI